MLFDIRHMTAPDNENNLQPFGGQGPKRFVMAMTSLTLLPVIGQSPFAPLQADKRKQVDGVTQAFVAGKAEFDHLVFTTAVGNRHRTRLRLQMPEGFPSAQDVADFRPYHRNDHSAFSRRQSPGYLSRRHGGEKTFDLITVVCHRLSDYPEFRYQDLHQAFFGPHHMAGIASCGAFASSQTCSARSLCNRCSLTKRCQASGVSWASADGVG